MDSNIGPPTGDPLHWIPQQGTPSRGHSSGPPANPLQGTPFRGLPQLTPPTDSLQGTSRGPVQGISFRGPRTGDHLQGTSSRRHSSGPPEDSSSEPSTGEPPPSDPSYRGPPKLNPQKTSSSEPSPGDPSSVSDTLIWTTSKGPIQLTPLRVSPTGNPQERTHTVDPIPWTPCR